MSCIRSRAAWLRRLTVSTLILAAGAPALGVWTANLGLDVNALVGATRFYNEGYTGSRSVITNTEGGFIWNEHETLEHVSTFFNDASASYGADRHATWVGQMLAGRADPTDATHDGFQRGIAFGSDLWSASLATGYVGTPFTRTFNISEASLAHGYVEPAMVGAGGRTTDVINSSWGGGSATGFDYVGVCVDAVMWETGKTFVASAGNNGPDGNTVRSPAGGYNGISVGALGSELSGFDTVSSFSSRGPNDYFDPNTGDVIHGVRPVVDIVAPGQDLALAYYGGTTGGNTGGVDFPGSNLYSYGVQGTSFAAPIVAGGAALVTDVGYDRFGGGRSIDGRTVKAVLMNSADKIAGWDNGQFFDGDHIVTTQVLDWSSGAGALNLDAAFDQYTAGTTDLPGDLGGTVDPIGWDFGVVTEDLTNDYFIDSIIQGGTTITTTLTWFQTSYWSATEDIDYTDDLYILSLDDLDLEVWSVVDGIPEALIAESVGGYETVEHLSFVAPETGSYMIRVKWFGENYDFIDDANETSYGLAWATTAVPAPGVGVILMMGVLGVRSRRRR